MGLAFGRTLQKCIASWNNKPPGKGPFNDSRASQRARRVLGKPKDGQTLYLAEWPIGAFVTERFFILLWGNRYA
jgi:hypothetical protein